MGDKIPKKKEGKKKKAEVRPTDPTSTSIATVKKQKKSYN